MPTQYSRRLRTVEHRFQPRLLVDLQAIVEQVAAECGVSIEEVRVEAEQLLAAFDLARLTPQEHIRLAELIHVAQSPEHRDHAELLQLGAKVFGED